MTHSNLNAASRAAASVSPAPGMWPGVRSIQWGCALLHLLGEDDLARLPLLLSGARPPETSQPAVGHAGAIRRTRELVGALPTQRSVYRAAYELKQQATLLGYDPSFHIDLDTLRFTLVPGHQVLLDQALATLQTPNDWDDHGLTVAPWGDLVAQLGPTAAPVNVRVRLPPLDLTPAPQYDLHRQPDSELRVTMADLAATAADLDQLDQNQPDGATKWAPERWQQRLHNVIRLQQCEPDGLTDTDTLDLSQLKHLIGLPGAGKTTLIMLLCAHLARAGKRVAVFFTSIETAREYLEKLTRYDVRTALLMGRSADTHRAHADRLAELIGADSRDRGFARTRAGAELLAQTCPLPAFATDQDSAWSQWPALEAPCERITVAGDVQGKRHLCPLWSRCGRVRNQRELVEASVWLGHVRSADTTVPSHATSKKLTYFELIGGTFDLVIFDEVDEAQKSLDALGARTRPLFGTTDSEYMRSQAVTSQVLSGRRELRGTLPLFPYQTVSNSFERHGLRFYLEVMQLMPTPDPAERQRRADDAASLFEQLEHRPLTTNYLVRLALPHTATAAERSARYAFWDSALYAAFYDSTIGEWSRAAELYQDLPFGGVPETKDAWQQLRSAFERYLKAFPANVYLTDELEALAECFVRLVSPSPFPNLAALARVLVAVGFTVATYQQLMGLTRPLVQAGLLLPEAARHETSTAMQLAVPLSLLGIFSSVRFSRSPEGRGLMLDYLMLDNTPRMLLHRLHERGANVLLASATSWLPDSSAYHVDVAPRYVLVPRRQQETKLSLHLLLMRQEGHPNRSADTPRPALRFSGAGRDEQLANLREMVRQLASKRANRPNSLSILERAAIARQTPAPHRRPRKCALVVNSYEQVVEVLRELRRVNPALAKLSRGVVKNWPEETLLREMCVLRGQVEALGHEEELLVVVFPLPALGRGINIVFHTGEPGAPDADSGTAALGSIYFLTRPHPVINDLSLMLSRVAEQAQQFDKLDFTGQPLAAVQAAYDEARRDLYQDTMQLLSQPLQASRLPIQYMRAFAANLLIPVLQTIGRAIRGSRPADVYFVDAAWAPNSADDEPDSERTSVLVMMQKLLKDYMSTPDPGQRAILQALYQPFADAFADIEGLRTGGSGTGEEATQDDTSTYYNLEDQGDLADY
jgi:hypothetical protein